jgi:predicted AAA+ superfamily ATPase
MVTRSLAVDRVISKLRIEQFCLLKGPPGSGKSTAAKYIGYLLAESNPPWSVYILNPRWEAAAKLYDSLDTTRLIVTLAALEYTHQRILLMFDDVHEAPGIIY